MHICTCTYANTCTYMHIHVHTCTYMYMHIQTHAFIHKHTRHAHAVCTVGTSAVSSYGMSGGRSPFLNTAVTAFLTDEGSVASTVYTYNMPVKVSQDALKADVTELNRDERGLVPNRDGFIVEQSRSKE